MRNTFVWRALALVGVGVCTSLFAGTPPAPAGTSVTTPARAGAQHGSAGVLALDWGDIDSTPGAWRGNYVVLQSWETARIPALRAKNPGVKVLMYKDVSAAVKTPHESGVFSTGVSYAEAADRDWLLRDRGGRVIEWSDWAGLYPTDIGDRGYQAAWGDHVLAELRRGGWDGVMMDDTLTYLSHDTVGGRVAAEIPDDAAMYDATESFLAGVATRIARQGFLAVPNVTVEWDTWHDVMTDWTPYVSGWENEYAVKWGLDRSGPRFVGADWEWKMEMAAWCADRDVPLLAITYSNRGDVATQVYHRATWLLTWNGRTGSSIFVPEEAFTDHWLPRATVDVGLPKGPRVRLVSGVWRRSYSGGLVLVNPTTNTRTVSLARAYTKLGGKRVTQIRVPALSGAILRG